YNTASGSKTLFFTKDSFFYKETISQEVSGKNGDTISYGIWTVDKNVILLSTPHLSTDRELELDVNERSSVPTDTIYIYINSPAEMEYQLINKTEKKITYRIRIETGDGSSYYQRRRPSNIDSNVIKFYKPRGINLKAFSIEIFPNGENEWQQHSLIFWTKQYKVLNPLSNVFNVDIPGLTWKFLSYRRLTRDFVRILSLDKLEWDGDIFQRK
ncbi:MAG TPA: hypothetical protein VN451_04120, partial [Chitinophagaceae bacterium]|nr:hypothetical protein [Chitinophagaceae bacterium]